MVELPKALVLKLQSICEREDIAAPIFRALAQRERPRPQTDLYRLRLQIFKQGTRITDVDVLKFFTMLSKAGFGTVKVKALPDHSNFNWSYNPIEVAEVAVTFLKGDNVNTAVLKPEVRNKPTQGGIRVFAPVGEETVALTLPHTFNMKQAESLGRYLMQIARQIERGES